MELPDNLSLDLSDGLCGIGWGITYLLRERFITGEIKDVLSDIDIKIQETEILNDDTLKDYHTYLMFRKEYIGEDAQRGLPYSPYRESYIQKKIWETCFSQNQLEMNQ